MMLNRRHALGLGSALLAAGALGACGRQGGSSSGGENALTVWVGALEDSQKKDMDRLVEAFQGANEGVTVTYQTHSTDELKESMRQVSGTKAGPDIYWYWEGPGLGGTVNWHVMRLLDSLIETRCGADVARALVTDKKGWDTEPGVAAAFTDLKKWADSYINTGYMSMSNDDSNLLFWNGQAAMALEGTWYDAQCVDNGMDVTKVGIFPFPTGTGRLYGFGEGFYVNANTDKADLAASFLDFITSADQMRSGGGAWAAVSVNKDVEVSDANPLDALWPPILKSSERMYNNYDQALNLDETTEYWRIQNAVLIGDMQPSEAGPAMQKFIDANA